MFLEDISQNKNIITFVGMDKGFIYIFGKIAVDWIMYVTVIMSTQGSHSYEEKITKESFTFFFG